MSVGSAAKSYAEHFGSVQGEFTLAYHFYASRDPRNHLELFLDTDGSSALETWRHFPHRPGARYDRRLRFFAAPPHRRVYLNFSGPVSGDRGRLRILRRGVFIDRRKKCGAPAQNEKKQHSILVTL
ncbi:MAG: hypothetical protein N2Z22_08050 [Turneriella sp.]|nr:hypothetical protein [Turneriella sp.]